MKRRPSVRHLISSLSSHADVSPLGLAVRKIDRRLVPIVWGLYVLSYLDRANIGNAKSGGMEKDLALTSEQYSVVLLVFFVGSALLASISLP